MPRHKPKAQLGMTYLRGEDRRAPVHKGGLLRDAVQRDGQSRQQGHSGGEEWASEAFQVFVRAWLGRVGVPGRRWGVDMTERRYGGDVFVRLCGARAVAGDGREEEEEERKKSGARRRGPRSTDSGTGRSGQSHNQSAAIGPPPDFFFRSRLARLFTA